MEADWEVEIGGNAPVIEASWPGFVDLRQSPQRAFSLPETADYPALAEALIRLNASNSPVWTSKCDLWPQLEADAFDPSELDAPPDHAAHAVGCYIDLLPRESQLWATPQLAVSACQRVCALLRANPLPCARLDLILRQANPAPDQQGLGVTAYLTACGPSPSAAARTLADALALFAGAFRAESTLQ
jgi:hypothetical protein